ncbi:isochorismatase family protein [Rhodobacteraceae bacterium D3-12]|nr:isochorismatase family protein [Rhodobacteraceae bacterium D3-12]
MVHPGSRLVSKLTMGGTALAGGPDTGLARDFNGLPDHVLIKRVQDGFETSALDRLLDKLEIGTLDIAGLDGAYCVARTAEAALNRGYGVTLVEAAILRADSAAYEKAIAPLITRGLIRA